MSSCPTWRTNAISLLLKGKTHKNKTTTCGDEGPRESKKYGLIFGKIFHVTKKNQK